MSEWFGLDDKIIYLLPILTVSPQHTLANLLNVIQGSRASGLCAHTFNSQDCGSEQRTGLVILIMITTR